MTYTQSSRIGFDGSQKKKIHLPPPKKKKKDKQLIRACQKKKLHLQNPSPILFFIFLGFQQTNQKKLKKRKPKKRF
jgi:hypothetical protein